jgi:hypothetical protein
MRADLADTTLDRRFCVVFLEIVEGLLQLVLGSKSSEDCMHVTKLLERSLSVS